MFYAFDTQGHNCISDIYKTILAHFTFFMKLLMGRADGKMGRGRGTQEWTWTCRSLLHTAAVVAQDFALLTQMLRVLLALVRDIQTIRLLQRTLGKKNTARFILSISFKSVLPTINLSPPQYPARAVAPFKDGDEALKTSIMESHASSAS